MKIEYTYKKEHQEVVDKIQARIDKLLRIHDKEVTNTHSKCRDEGMMPGSLTWKFMEPSPPCEVGYLKEQLEYLKGCLSPTAIKIIEEEEVLL
jgi:hypothetical protein